MLTYILIGVAVLLVVFLIVAVRQPDDLRVKRSITISAPATLAFAQINDLRKWQEISPYAKYDPAAKFTFAGPASGVGSSAEWAGNSKVGAGRMTITESRPDELVRFKFEFFKPWYCTNTTDFIFRSTGAGTDVTWAMSMKNNFIAKASGLVMNMDKMMGESFEAGLVNLKNLAEAAVKK
jgi:Polyketide cyclase / dehydrase and lipid transport